MNESFILFVWRHQYFDKSELRTCQGENLVILSTGYGNTDSGPDFMNARIRIGNIVWYGNVEIHLKSSDWMVHQHHRNEAYDNVILHVVWENDKPIKRTDHSEIPTLELRQRTDSKLLDKYTRLVNTGNPAIQPACYETLRFTPEVIYLSMLETTLITRLQKKAREILKILAQCNGDWEETTFRILCQNFGFKLNADAFMELGKSIPFKILKKHADNLFQIEAFLFGQAGMLESDYQDKYVHELQKEYSFLSRKYNLAPTRLNPFIWKFLRTRPANFPTIRIAQLAKFISSVPYIFSLFSETDSSEHLMNILNASPSEYWQKHYTFDKLRSGSGAKVGKESINNILINTVVPIIAAVAVERDNEALMDRAIAFLEKIPGENNRITKMWNRIGLRLEHAGDTQAAIELFNSYCSKRLCLHCRIGLCIINKI